jgi:flagellar operon protein
MIAPIRIDPVGAAPVVSKNRPASAGPPGQFASVFDKALRQAEEVRFSAHARQRLEERGITLEEAELNQLRAALDTLASKGARSSLLVLERVALVLSVPNRTVITAMPSEEAAQTVFTNIDSAVVAGAAPAKSTITQGPVPERGGPGAAERSTRRTAQEISL